MYAKAQINNIIKNNFIKGYKEDKKYAYIIAKIKKRLTNENNSSFFRAGYPFIIINNLLYNIAANGTRSLYVPYAIIKSVLVSAYDEKHYFGRERIFYDLRRLVIYKKLYEVKRYIKYYPSYNVNVTLRKPPYSDY